jgi:hypothetical protein
MAGAGEYIVEGRFGRRVLSSAYGVREMRYYDQRDSRESWVVRERD